MGVTVVVFVAMTVVMVLVGMLVWVVLGGIGWPMQGKVYVLGCLLVCHRGDRKNESGDKTMRI